MNKLDSLKLTNKMEIDTSIAEVYINSFKNITWPESGWFYHEQNTGNIIKTKEHCNVLASPRRKRLQTKNAKSVMHKLAKQIEDNADMFVQLEYLLRQTDPRDVREGHVKLMSQLLRCDPTIWNGYTGLLYFNERTPLYNLVYVVGMSTCSEFSTGIILSDKKFRPLCKFFATLCSNVGIEDIDLVYANPADAEALLTSYGKSYNESANNVGCTGVLAERADVDSAIECFINSSATAPWRFKYIYIQESIFDYFKDSIKAQCNVIDDTGDITVRGKTFLIERQDGQGIPTNAFRTAKELISMIQTPYLSIWAAETALSHEIALLSSSATIWINDFGSFFGPPRSALSVFTSGAETTLRCDGDIQKRLSAWSKLTIEERLNVIVEAVADENDLSYFDIDDSLIEITDNTICFGKPQHLGAIMINFYMSEDIEHSHKWLRILKILLNGSAIVCDGIPFSILRKLNELGAPITSYSNDLINSSENCICQVPMLLERLKVVRTNYGTIFAN